VQCKDARSVLSTHAQWPKYIKSQICQGEISLSYEFIAVWAEKDQLDETREAENKVAFETGSGPEHNAIMGQGGMALILRTVTGISDTGGFAKKQI
jgi:hypothetical protein